MELESPGGVLESRRGLLDSRGGVLDSRSGVDSTTCDHGVTGGARVGISSGRSRTTRGAVWFSECLPGFAVIRGVRSVIPAVRCPVPGAHAVVPSHFELNLPRPAVVRSG